MYVWRVLFMSRKIKPIVCTILVMHLVGIVAVLGICFADYMVNLAGWIEYALQLLVHVILGLVCGISLKCCFHKRRLIKMTVCCYWITYVILTLVMNVGETKNLFELLIILLLLLFSASLFH